MKRRQVVSAVALCIPLIAGLREPRAQSRGKMIVIGFLDGGERREWWEAFQHKMQDLGYVAGRNVTYEARFAKGNLEALPALTAELLQLNPAILVTSSSAAAVAAEHATQKIPIVMASGADQVSRGLAVSLARPGANVTGVASVSSDLMVKRFELLRELAPKSARVAALWHADNPSTASVRELEGAAARAKVAFQSIRFKDGAALSDVFSAMTRDHVDAVVVIHGPLVYAERKTIAQLALKHKLPAIYGAAEYVDAGGLLAYGPSYPELYRRAAIYVDKILKGANPGDLPIEQPTTFELVVNADTARAMGIVIPPALMARASRVVK